MAAPFETSITEDIDTGIGASSPQPTGLRRQPKQSSGSFAFFAESKFKAIIDGEEKSFFTADEKFEALARVWKNFKTGRSVVEYNHAAYWQIVGMGTEVVPVLLRHIRQNDTDWVLALKYITGAVVTTPQMQGDIDAIRAAWLDWGDRNGPGT